MANVLLGKNAFIYIQIVATLLLIEIMMITLVSPCSADPKVVVRVTILV